MRPPPQWATNIVEKFCYDRNIPTPEIRWRRMRKEGASGGRMVWDTPPYIYISAGSHLIHKGRNKDDQKLTLIHELTHWSFQDKQVGHTSEFWDRAWDNYREFKVPIRYALTWEGWYRKEAIKAYRRNLQKRRVSNE